MDKFPAEWHTTIQDTTLIDDPEERISVRAWNEFFELQNKGFSIDVAGKLIFADKATDLLDAIHLSQVD